MDTIMEVTASDDPVVYRTAKQSMVRPIEMSRIVAVRAMAEHIAMRIVDSAIDNMDGEDPATFDRSAETMEAYMDDMADEVAALLGPSIGAMSRFVVSEVNKVKGVKGD